MASSNGKCKKEARHLVTIDGVRVDKETLSVIKGLGGYWLIQGSPRLGETHVTVGTIRTEPAARLLLNDLRNAIESNWHITANDCLVLVPAKDSKAGAA